MTVPNDLDRFHLVMDTIDRLPQTGATGVALKRQLQAKLIEHKAYIAKHGEDLPEIRDWQWGAPTREIPGPGAVDASTTTTPSLDRWENEGGEIPPPVTTPA